MRPRGKVAVSLLRALLDRGSAAGVDVAGVLDEIGVPRATLAELNGWISVDAMARAWVLVPERSGDPDFGLYAAESLPIGVHGVLEFSAMSRANLREAFESFVRYYRLLGAMGQLELEMQPDRAIVRVHPIVDFPAERLRHFIEHMLALIVSRGRILAGDEVAPVEVRFMHGRPPSTAAHDRVFRSALSFGHATNEMFVDRAILELPLRTANPAVSAALEESAETMLGLDVEDVLERVRGALREALESGDARLEMVARRLRVGARTLQRRLSDEGTTYAQVLDEVRRETAQRWVQQGSMSFGEIAFALGFSEPSAFHRAFKRWTGTTPKAYQASGMRR
jgi:AraC-like DNA-binding protein